MIAWLENLPAMDAGFLCLTKVTVILIITGILQWALRWSSPQWRVLLWRGAWLSIIVAILASVILPAWEVRVVTTKPRAPVDAAAALPDSPPAELQTAESPTLPLPQTDDGAIVGNALPPLANTAWHAPTPGNVARIIWIGIASVLSGRWVSNYLSLRALRHRATPASASIVSLAADVAREMGMSQTPKILVSSEITSPCTVAVRTPVILLSDSDSPDIRAILAHEIAHVRSCDLLWIWMIDWLTAILWFHPLCWLMRQDHRFACEAASDSAAAIALKDRKFYSAALARLALAVDHRQSPAAVSMVRSAQVVRRLRLLERYEHSGSISPIKISLASILTLVIALGIGTFNFSVAREPEDQGAPQSSVNSSADTRRMTLMALQLRALRLDRLDSEHGLEVFGDLRKPLDRERLTHLAAHPREDRFALKILICRAAAEKDNRFLFLLDQEELRNDPWIDIALSAYDYSVNHNDEALESILSAHAKEAPGSDSDTVLVLSAIDEWERSIPAILKHFEKGTDGAGGIAESSFWGTRKQLYPEELRQYVKQFHLEPLETFRGLDLTSVPATEHSRDLPNIWVETAPGSKSYKIKDDVIDFRILFEGTVYAVPKTDQFYVSHPFVASKLITYGPFEGNPFVTLNLAEDLEERALRLDDPLARHHAREVLKKLISSKFPAMHRLGVEISERIEARTAEQSYLNRSVKEWDDLFKRFSSRDRQVLALIGYGTAEVDIPPIAVPMLLHLAMAGHPETRCRCLGTLRKLKYPSAEVMDTLLTLLNDPAPGCRHRAGYVLGSYQSRSDYLVPRLTAMIEKGDESLSEVAALALKGLDEMQATRKQ